MKRNSLDFHRQIEAGVADKDTACKKQMQNASPIISLLTVIHFNHLIFSFGHEYCQLLFLSQIDVLTLINVEQ
jgi:hypothetical protein